MNMINHGMRVVSFKKEHLIDLDLQHAQSYLSDHVKPDFAAYVENTDWAFSGIDGAGRVIGCAGILLIEPHRAMAWSYISTRARREIFIWVHKQVKKFLDNCYLKRIEMVVDCEFPQGHRWAKMLGFNLEAKRMVGYRLDGGDCALYARVRP
jgi:hypothetical protein